MKVEITCGKFDLNLSKVCSHFKLNTFNLYCNNFNDQNNLVKICVLKFNGNGANNE